MAGGAWRGSAVRVAPGDASLEVAARLFCCSPIFAVTMKKQDVPIALNSGADV
jgi:hypothetical protein